MKAIVQTGYGAPDELELREVDPPRPGEGEVLVRVRAASLHPDVWHVVRGWPLVVRLMGSGLLRPRIPIPGTDMAGTVEALGPGATRFQPGDGVFGETMDRHQWANGGAFAEYVVVREEWIEAKPPGVSFEVAASVPTSGFITLLNLRDRERTGPGREVLVNGAGGGVGSLALQIAKDRGAHVTAVDAPGKRSMLRALGADEVVDYTRVDFTRTGEHYDLIFDIPGNHTLAECRRALKPSGRYVLIGHEGFGQGGRAVLGLLPRMIGLMIRSRFVEHLRGPGVPPPTRPEAMAALRDLLERGAITPVIDSTYPLTEVREAFRHMIRDELHGKVVLTVP